MIALNQHHEFEKTRPKLLGLAYRILGSYSDAEDAVQETFIKLSKSKGAEILNLESWLTTVCTRICLDHLKSAHQNRVTYIGHWLPEPIHTPVENQGEKTVELASSLTTAFLLMLERLTPKERAAYLLYEIFESSYSELSETLGLQESACRKLVSRAKRSIALEKVRRRVPQKEQEAFLSAFQSAITTGDESEIKHLLAEDVCLTADGGGKVPTIRNELVGRHTVLSFLVGALKSFWQNYRWELSDISGGKGVVILDDNNIQSIAIFSFNEDNQVSNIYIVRNPDKLKSLARIFHQLDKKPG